MPRRPTAAPGGDRDVFWDRDAELGGDRAGQAIGDCMDGFDHLGW